MQENDHIASEPISAPYPSPNPFQLSGDKLLSVLESVGIQDIPIAIKYLANRLITSQHHDQATHKKHSWDSYKLSEEVLEMSPKERKDIYGDYKSMMESIMQEEYK